MYKIGDQVTLNSGGPSMLVVTIDEMTKRVCVVWVRDDAKLEEHWFPIICLRLVDGPSTEKR